MGLLEVGRNLYVLEIQDADPAYAFSLLNLGVAQN
jgi:hypothetical protein